jgi:hypothetical protein
VGYRGAGSSSRRHTVIAASWTHASTHQQQTRLCVTTGPARAKVQVWLARTHVADCGVSLAFVAAVYRALAALARSSMSSDPDDLTLVSQLMAIAATTLDRCDVSAAPANQQLHVLCVRVLPWRQSVHASSLSPQLAVIRTKRTCRSHADRDICNCLSCRLLGVARRRCSAATRRAGSWTGAKHWSGSQHKGQRWQRHAWACQVGSRTHRAFAAAGLTC